MKKIIVLLAIIITTAHMDFVIHIPSIVPLYIKMDSTVQFSGGIISIVDGVAILSYP